jgi:hypothetical protein
MLLCHVSQEFVIAMNNARAHSTKRDLSNGSATDNSWQGASPEQPWASLRPRVLLLLPGHPVAAVALLSEALIASSEGNETVTLTFALADIPVSTDAGTRSGSTGTDVPAHQLDLLVASISSVTDAPTTRAGRELLQVPAGQQELLQSGPGNSTDAAPSPTGLGAPADQHNQNTPLAGVKLDTGAFLELLRASKFTSPGELGPQTALIYGHVQQQVPTAVHMGGR